MNFNYVWQRKAHIIKTIRDVLYFCFLQLTRQTRTLEKQQKELQLIKQSVPPELFCYHLVTDDNTTTEKTTEQLCMHVRDVTGNTAFHYVVFK